MKDKNGIEIYYKDIIKNHRGVLWVVTYYRGAFRYCPIETFMQEDEPWFETDNLGNFGT